MPKVTVWECPHSYMLFRTEAEYRAHLKKLARQRAADKRRKIALKKRNDKMDELYQCRDFTEIENWLKANWQFVADKNAIAPISISFQSMHWSQTSGNSHSAPKGRITNWGTGKPSAPKGYPGWSGKLFITYDREPNLSTFDVLRNTNIYAGTGGGWKSFQASTNLWAEDFPNMVEQKDLYPQMVPQNARGDIDLSDERILPLNWLMLSKGDARIEPNALVTKWLNRNCGKRHRMCVGEPSTWHFFLHSDQSYVFLNTTRNKDKFAKHFMVYRNNWELLKTLPQISDTCHRFREADKAKLGEQSFSYGCLCLDDIEFEPLGEVLKVDMYRLFTDRDDFTLYTVQANDINKPVSLTPW